MSYARGLRIGALWLLTACNGAPRADAAVGEPVNVGGAADQQLSDEELDRLLDALEQELQSQGAKRPASAR